MTRYFFNINHKKQKGNQTEKFFQTKYSYLFVTLSVVWCQMLYVIRISISFNIVCCSCFKMMEAINASKALLRKEIKQKISALSSDYKKQQSDIIAKKVTNIFSFFFSFILTQNILAVIFVAFI